MNYEQVQLHLNQAGDRFELVLEAGTAFMEYKLSGTTLFLIHTEVPESLEGKGVGSALVLKVLEYAKASQFQIVPLCPFVQTYLQRHQEWNAIVSPDAGRFLDKN